MTNKSSSLELFSDILTITLALTILVALLSAITASDNQLFTPEQSDQLRSILVEEQIDIAEQQLKSLRADNDTYLARHSITREAALSYARSQVVDQALDYIGHDAYQQRGVEAITDIKAATMRQNQRLSMDLSRIQVIDKVCKKRITNLARLVEENIEDSIQASNRNINYLRAMSHQRNPLYVVVRGELFYPLFSLSGQTVSRNDVDVGWIDHKASGVSVAIPKYQDGMRLYEWNAYCEEGLNGILAGQHYIVYITYPDSFVETRAALRNALEEEYPVSWYPLEENEAIKFRKDGFLLPRI